ncbi:hypothetical protein [Mycoplasma sp. Z1473D]
MKKIPATSYEDFKNQPQLENSEEWVSKLFTFMFSEGTSLPKRANSILTKDQSLFHQLEEQKQIFFRFPYFTDTFPSFLQYYTTEYKDLYKSMMFEKSSKLKEKGQNIVINFLLNMTPQSQLSNLITRGVISELKEQTELRELFKSYTDEDGIVFNKYIHSHNVLIQWRVLQNAGKKFSHLLLSYNNFEIRNGENTPATIRNVLVYGDNKDPEPLPIPWKVKLSKLNYLLILDRDGYFYKLNDFIDNSEFKTVRHLFKFNLWELTFSKETMSKQKSLREEYENRIKEQETRQKAYDTLRTQYEKNKKNSAFSGDYVTNPDNGQKTWKNRQQWLEQINNTIISEKEQLENLSLIISELKKEIENGSDGRALPPRISDVKYLDFMESEQETDTYDFTFYTKNGRVWYGRIKVDILSNTVQIIRGGWVTLEPKADSPNIYAVYSDATGISLCNYYDENRDLEYTRLMMLPNSNEEQQSEFRHLFEVNGESGQYNAVRRYQASGVNWNTTDSELLQRQRDWEERWKGNYGLEAMEKRPILGYVLSNKFQPKSDRKLGVFTPEPHDYTNRPEWRKLFAHLFLSYNTRTENNKKIAFRFNIDFLNPELDNGEFILNKEHNVKLNKRTIVNENWDVHTLEFSISYTPEEFKTIWLEKFIEISKLEKYLPEMLTEENYLAIEQTVINLTTLKQSDKFKTEYKIKKNAGENNRHLMEIYLAGVKFLELTLPYSTVDSGYNTTNKSHCVFRFNNFGIDIPAHTTQINKYKFIEKKPFALLIKEDSSRAFQLNFIAEQCYNDDNIADNRKFEPIKIEDKWVYYSTNLDYFYNLFSFDLSQDNSETEQGQEIKRLDVAEDGYYIYDGEEIEKILKISYQNKESFVIIKNNGTDIENREYGIDLFTKSGDRTQSNKWIKISDKTNGSLISENRKLSDVSLAFWEENSLHIVWDGSKVYTTLYNTKPFSIIQNPFLYTYRNNNYQFLADAIEPARFESANKLISLPIEDVRQIENKITAYAYLNENTLNYISNNSIDKQWCLIGNDGVARLSKFNNKIIKTQQENITFTATIEVNFAYYNADTDTMVPDMDSSILLASIFSNSDNLTKLKSNILSFEIWKQENGEKILKVPAYSINLVQCEKTIKNNAVWVRVPMLLADTTSQTSTYFFKNFKIGDGNQFRKFSQWSDEIKIESNKEVILKDIIYSLNI